MANKHLISFVVCLTLVGAVAANAQVVYQPTPAPRLSAADRGWYQRSEPIPFAGELYYPAGPTIYFNGNLMIPTGSHDGVPLYTDPTLEAYSLIYVPVGGGLLRPYERRRAGGFAGTTGSRAPSFTVQQAGQTSVGVEPALAPLAEPAAAPAAESIPAIFGSLRPDTDAIARFVPQSRQKRPEKRDLWLDYEGYRWRTAGRAIPIASTSLVRIGEYHGFSVYAEAGERPPRRIFLPSREGLVAPYERTTK